VTEYKIAIGGLMRCCIASIRAWQADHAGEEVPDGTVIRCQYEQGDGSEMIRRGDTWHWNRCSCEYSEKECPVHVG
jgi:hypothetical protein